ncbi:hypothetical protein JZU46_01600 [bacterium]|nr:hypothetical protein [bacterium]
MLKIKRPLEAQIYLFTGILIGLLDMTINGPLNFRASELFLIPFLFLFNKVKIKIDFTLIFWILTINTCIFFIALYKYDYFFWTLKLLIFAIASLSAFKFGSINTVFLGLGILIGFEIFSLWLVLSGQWFLAKYTSVILAFGFIILAGLKNKIFKIYGLLFLLLCLLIAYTSNSRGQFFLTFLAILIALLATKEREIHINRSWMIAFSFALPVLFLFAGFFVGTEVILRKSLVEIVEFNAGDLERSMFSVYALVTAFNFPFGHSLAEIENSVGDIISSLNNRETQTNSSHNIIGDVLLYLGWLGVGFIFFIARRFYIILMNASRDISRVDFFMLSFITCICFLILATSPVAGLERIEIFVGTLFIGLITRKYNKSLEL